MIENEHQLQVTRRRLADFNRSIVDFRIAHRGQQIILLNRAILDGLTSMRNDLQAQIDEYHQRKNEPTALIHHTDP